MDKLQHAGKSTFSKMEFRIQNLYKTQDKSHNLSRNVVFFPATAQSTHSVLKTAESNISVDGQQVVNSSIVL